MIRKGTILGGVTALALLASGAVVASALNDVPQDAQPARNPTADLNRQSIPQALPTPPVPQEPAPEAEPAPAAPVAITPPAPVIVIAEEPSAEETEVAEEETILLVNLSGRGDKDMEQAQRLLGFAA